MNWEERNEVEVNEFVCEMLNKYDITVVTSDVQKKNGTIMFKYGNERFGVYKSGMVRKYFKTGFRAWSCYQLNKTRQYTRYYEKLDDFGRLKVVSYSSVKRVKVISQLARLKYLEQYLIRNRGLSEDIITINGVKYRKIND